MDNLLYYCKQIGLPVANIAVYLLFALLLAGYFVNTVVAISLVGDWNQSSGLTQLESVELIVRFLAFFIVIPFDSQRTALAMLVGLLTWAHLLLASFQLIPNS